jgi:hypothetical protein
MAAVPQPLERGRADADSAESGRQLRPHLAGRGVLASYQRSSALDGGLAQIIDHQHPDILRYAPVIISAAPYRMPAMPSRLPWYPFGDGQVGLHEHTYLPDTGTVRICRSWCGMQIGELADEAGLTSPYAQAGACAAQRQKGWPFS